MSDHETRNPWSALRRFTPARIGLGRAGISLTTEKALEFQLAHARARTAVHTALDRPALAGRLGGAFPGVVMLESRAPDRAAYLQRPDWGRRLAPEAAARLTPGACDLAVVICDGLSALAVAENAGPFLDAFLDRAARESWRLAPLSIVAEGRVAIGDEIGAALGARMVLMLIGERPGLSAADSLGLYLTHDPKPGRNDADRNCISNIRPGGLTYTEAAYRAHYLTAEALRRGISGVALKDDTVAEALPDGRAAAGPGFLIGS